MLGIIIYIAIIVFVICRVANNKKKKADEYRKKTGMAGKRSSQKPVSGQTGRQSVSGQTSRKPVSGQNRRQTQGKQKDARAKQRAEETKRRLEQKYKGESSILQAARESTAEYDRDVLREEDKRYHGKVNDIYFCGNREEDLLGRVYDLMVTGYSGNLNFERDFLSEGMDMLNRIGG